MATIAVSHLERGCGKSTVAISLAGEMQRRNLQVALVDADPGRASSLWAEPGNLDFAVYENAIAHNRIAAWASDIRRIDVDHLFIDAPSDELLAGAVLTIADVLVVPTTGSGDIEAIARLMGLVQAARSRRTRRLRAIIVPNRIDHEARAQQLHESEVGDLDALVVPGIVSHSDIASAFASGRAICESAPGSEVDLQIRQLCNILQREIALAVHS